MTDWKAPTREPCLGPDEIHLWRISLSREPRIVRDRMRLLSDDERDRAARFKFDLYRERFILRRGALRILLGLYLKVPPREVELLSSPRGKPEVRQSPDAPPLRFNLSDSENLALLGVTLDREIGVDIEHLRRIPDMDAVARDHFSHGEYAAYRSVAPSERVACFYNAWTRKEAWLKARGDGLRVDLGSFEVTLIPSDAPRLVSIRDEPREAERWWLHACTPLRGYVAAIAVAGGDARIEKLVMPAGSPARPDMRRSGGPTGGI